MLHQPKNITLTYNEVVGYNCNNTTIYGYFQPPTVKDLYYSLNTSLYDPALARMLSPDNYVPAPHNPQAYNRYSYCLNNPLKYVDPDGEFIQYIIGAVIGGFGGYMMADNLGYKGWDKFWHTLGGAAIGGGWGAFAGGATAGGLGTWMSGGSDEDILKGAALGGVMGLGVYHASLAYSYHASGIKGTGLKYNQYTRMMRLTQRSMFWNREGKFIPNSEGGFNVNALGDRNNTVPSNVPGDYENALFDYHTHQEFGYDRFSNIQDAIAVGKDPVGTDVTTRQALTLFANRGKIDPMTMYLGTREGQIHYWTHYGVQGTLNYNFSHVFTPYNLLWSMSLIR